MSTFQTMDNNVTASETSWALVHVCSLVLLSASLCGKMPIRAPGVMLAAHFWCFSLS